jgi:hypothetical protein
MLVSRLCFVALLGVRLGLSAECHGKPSPDAKPNLNYIDAGSPKLIGSTTHGKLFTVGDGDDAIQLLHVWGTPYEMGYAHGSLLKEKSQDMLEGVWAYFELQVEQAINGTIDFLPSWFLRDVADVGLDVALDLEILATQYYSGDYFLQEINGLADASGVDSKKIHRIHMIGELTKGACSMFGANSSATPDSSLLQLRALDWNVDGPFKNFPQITVYHPHPGSGYAFANIGWTGWIGSITGVSSQKLAISEIGVSFPDNTFGDESRFGTPFTYLLRDILQFDDSLQKAMHRISSAHRTCDLILGVGDGKVSVQSVGCWSVNLSAGEPVPWSGVLICCG